jgi:hypothetical protein
MRLALVVPGDVVGVGSELPARLDPAGFRARHRLEGPFLLYVGRVDRRLGENGRRYVEANYAWPVVEGKYLDLLGRLRREDEAA